MSLAELFYSYLIGIDRKEKEDRSQGAAGIKRNLQRTNDIFVLLSDDWSINRIAAGEGRWKKYCPTKAT